MKLHTSNEKAAGEAFDRQSAIFDALYDKDVIVRYKRRRVRSHVLRYLNPHSHILELNAGTGEDAVYFAMQGHTVHATDISEGMQRMLGKKVALWGLEDRISLERCSFTELDSLRARGPYDLIFSNFAGLNCTGELKKVLDSLPDLLKPGGMVTLVVLPRFCLWESLLVFRGKFKTAFRRLAGRRGASAHVEGVWFRCWYYAPLRVIRWMKQAFYVLGAEGLCTLVPPSYLEGFAERHPAWYAFLERQEARLKSKWPWKYTGDYVILSFVKKS